MTKNSFFFFKEENFLKRFLLPALEIPKVSFAIAKERINVL